MLLDQGRLTESEGRFRLVGDLGALAVPDSLQALLGARLDTLDEPARDLVGLGLGARAQLHGRRGRRPRRARPRTTSGACSTTSSSASSSSYDDDPRLARARPVPLRPGRPARGRLRSAGPTRAAGPAPRRGRRATSRLRRGRAGRDRGDATTWTPSGRLPRTMPTATFGRQARTSARGGGGPVVAIGAHASAAGYLADAVELAAGDERLGLREARCVSCTTRPTIAATEVRGRELVDAVGRATATAASTRAPGSSWPARSSVAGRPSEAGRRSRHPRRRSGRSPTRIPTGSG